MKCFINVVLLQCVAFIYCARLPAGIKTCKPGENFDKCVAEGVEGALKIFANGNKDIGLLPLEPLLITKMSAEGGGGVQINQKYTNLTLFGLTNVKVESVKFDRKKCLLELISLNPKIFLTGDYELSGQISIFQINGKGKTNQTLSNLKMSHVLSCEHYKKKETDHIRVLTYKATFLDYNIDLQFEDLIPGSKELSAELRTVLNENSNSIFTEVKPDVERNYSEVFKQITNVVFSKVPYEDIFPSE